MLDWLRRHGLEMQAAATDIVHGEPDYTPLTQFLGQQTWSKDETKKRLTHLITLLSGFRDNRLRDSAIKVAHRMIAELG